MAIIHQDTFTDSDGTGLDAHTPDVGGSWTEVSGVWEIQSNKAELQSGGPAIATVPTNASDVHIRVTIVCGDQTHGIVVRYVDSNNYFLIDMLNVIPDRLRIGEFVSGSYNERSNNDGVTYNVGTTRTIHVICRDQYIWAGDPAAAEGVFYGSATAGKTATTHGLRSNFTGTAATYDDWQVEDLGAFVINQPTAFLHSPIHAVPY